MVKTDVINDKKLIRKDLLLERKLLSKKEILLKNKFINNKLLKQSQLRNVNNILVYLPINNEVNTTKIIKNLFKLKKNVFLPAFSKKTKAWIVCQFKDWEKLETGPFKILQPINPKKVDIQTLDTALIPGVAFDRIGNRLGYGKGVYDRLLVNSNINKIGLAYDFQIKKKLPVDKYDLRMDMVLTEEKGFVFD